LGDGAFGSIFFAKLLSKVEKLTWTEVGKSSINAMYSEELSNVDFVEITVG
jgi:hypothetical protein